MNCNTQPVPEDKQKTILMENRKQKQINKERIKKDCDVVKSPNQDSLNLALLWMSICAKCGSIYHKSHKLQYDKNGFNKTKIVCNCNYMWYICHGHITHKMLEKLHDDLQKGKEISRSLSTKG